jgi:DNA-binding FrmR family transcriptional regulator
VAAQDEHQTRESTQPRPRIDQAAPAERVAPVGPRVAAPAGPARVAAPAGPARVAAPAGPARVAAPAGPARVAAPAGPARVAPGAPTPATAHPSGTILRAAPVAATPPRVAPARAASSAGAAVEEPLPPTGSMEEEDGTFRHSYTRDRSTLVRRLRRIEGQVRGIERMIEREEYCVDILQQTAALRAAVDSVALLVLEDHVQGCLKTVAEQGEADRYVEEVLDVVRRSLGKPIRNPRI